MKRATTMYLISMLILFIFMASGFNSQAQSSRKSKNTSSADIPDQSVFDNLEYRNIGPFRGGRSAAVTGVPSQPRTYYMGATGGGVWKTTNSGGTWINISDGFFGGTIGAVEVSLSDPNIVYAGGGEVTIRGNVSHGYGIWKSLDAGETWKYMGLKEGQYIPRIPGSFMLPPGKCTEHLTAWKAVVKDPDSGKVLMEGIHGITSRKTMVFLVERLGSLVLPYPR